MSNLPTLTRGYTPIDEPLTLATTKRYLKIPDADTEQDNFIWTLIKAIRNSAERYLKVSLINQGWQLSYDTYVPNVVQLMMGPIQRIDSVIVLMKDGVCTRIRPDVHFYYVTASGTKLEFNANIIGQKIDISYSTGYGASESDVPEPIKQGMLVHIAAIYGGNHGANIIPNQTQKFYNPYKQVSNA